MPRKKPRKSSASLATTDPPRNGRDSWTPQQLRELLDAYLSSGTEGFARVLALRFGRTPKAVEMILFHRLPADYTERGQRESLAEKVRRHPSALDPNRVPNRRDQWYCKYLSSRLCPPAVAALVNLPESVVQDILELD